MDKGKGQGKSAWHWMQINQEVPGFVIVSRKHSQKGCAGPLWQDLQNQTWWHWHRQTEHTVDRVKTVKLLAHASSSVKRKWWYHPALLQKFSQVIPGKHQAAYVKHTRHWSDGSSLSPFFSPTLHSWSQHFWTSMLEQRRPSPSLAPWAAGMTGR